MPRRLTRVEMAIGGYKFFKYITQGGLLNINLEVTKRCNARCNFCDYWKEGSSSELQDYVPVVKKLKPLSVSLTGGEPLLRRDLAQVIASLRRSFGFLFISLVTNGSLLTVERGSELWKAGLDELSISLDYLDERHDRDRGLPGLAEHILSVASSLRAAGVNLCFSVVLKSGNYREVHKILSQTSKMGIKVSLSTYNCWRIKNEDPMVPKDELLALAGVIAELKHLKKQQDPLTTSEYYLDKIPEFFEKRGIPGCTAGLNWIQVTPDGMIKRCSDHPVAGHFSEWHRGFFKPTRCDRCWYSCRGAAQEPWTLKRFLGMAKETLTS
ncbi:MAG: radical SAM protein [Thermodesulfobacteriota bacterium]